MTTLKDKAKQLMELNNNCHGMVNVEGHPGAVHYSNFAILNSADIAKRMLELEELLDEAVEALKFYADFQTWNGSCNTQESPPISMDSDGNGTVPGNKAMAALKKIEEGQSE